LAESGIIGKALVNTSQALLKKISTKKGKAPSAKEIRAFSSLWLTALETRIQSTKPLGTGESKRLE
jgi:hypothetical protein